MIVKFETSNVGMYVELDLGYICNYKCSYCPDKLHTGKSWLDFNCIVELLEKVKPLWLGLSGGEPTFYPNISNLILYCESKNIKVAMTTNGSSPLEWYSKYLPLINNLCISYHPEHANYEKFIEKIKFIVKTKNISVNIQMIPETFNKSLETAKLISKFNNVYVLLKPMLDLNTSKLYNYTEEQMKLLDSPLLHSDINFQQESVRLYLIDENEKRIQIRPPVVIAKGHNMLKGWKCWKGVNLLKVLPDGNIFKAVCDILEEPIGNIYNIEEFELPTEPSICGAFSCVCMTDIKSCKKEKIDENFDNR